MNQYRLERVNPNTGYKESIIYTGSLKEKPEGWKAVEKLN